MNKNKKRSRSTARIHRRAGDECDCAGCVCNRGVAVIADGGRVFFHIQKPRPYFLCGSEIERLDWLVFLIDRHRHDRFENLPSFIGGEPIHLADFVEFRLPVGRENREKI